MKSSRGGKGRKRRKGRVGKEGKEEWGNVGNDGKEDPGRRRKSAEARIEKQTARSPRGAGCI